MERKWEEGREREGDGRRRWREEGGRERETEGGEDGEGKEQERVREREIRNKMGRTRYTTWILGLLYRLVFKGSRK